MKKVLFTATVDSHILNFHMPYLKFFKEEGYEVHVATNTSKEIPYCDVKHQISFERSPIKWNNIKAIKDLKKIIDKEKFEIIHTHTPMGSVVTRLAAKRARNKLGTRVIYTAHGFHFYKGAPVLNWLVYYPIEKYLSKFTDDLITINKEDYELAKRNFKSEHIYYVPGVGLDSKKFEFNMTEEEKTNLRKSLDIEKEDFVLIYPAEFTKTKRQTWLINTLKPVLEENKKIHLLLPGRDSRNNECRNLVEKLGLSKQIHILGFRKDVPYLIAIADLAVSSSNREGLPINILESMYYGLPLVVTNCRGNRDLVKNGENGYVVNLNDCQEFRNKVLYLSEIKEEEKNQIKKINQEMIKQYLLDVVLEEMTKIYKRNVDNNVKQ